MKSTLLAILIVISLPGASTGCHHTSESSEAEHEGRDAHGHSEEADKEKEVEGILFREGKGLEVPEVTKVSLQLKTAEVSEGELQSTITRTGQIYKSAAEPSAENEQRALASVMISPAEAAGIEARSQVVVDGTDSGFVTAINKSALAATGKVEVLVAIQDSAKKFRVGNSVPVSFSSSANGQVTLIPRSALLETVNGTFVYVPNGKYFFKTAVTVGAKTDTSVEITDGLYPGDEVVSEAVTPLWLAELQATKGGVGCAHGH